MNTYSSNKKAYLALSLVCLIWGTTYLVNKLGVMTMPALYFTSVRQLIAAILLLAYVFLIKKEAWPDKQFLILQLVLGVLLISCGNGIGIYGLQYIDSSISAILATFSPILMAFFLSISKSEPSPNRNTWLGLILGSTGIIIICLEKFMGTTVHSTFIGIGFTLISIFCWAFGSVYSKIKSEKNSPLLAAGFQMLFGGIPVFVVSMFLEKPFDFTIELNHILIWLYTIILGSLVAYTCFIYCLKHLPVTLVSIHTYINPILAIFLGAIVLSEKITPWIITGTIISLIGVYIVSRYSK
jgi:drug/metabolite transporter (DMT)-like permease